MKQKHVQQKHVQYGKLHSGSNKSTRAVTGPHAQLFAA